MAYRGRRANRAPPPAAPPLTSRAPQPPKPSPRREEVDEEEQDSWSDTSYNQQDKGWPEIEKDASLTEEEWEAIQSAFKNHANDNWTATDKQLYCILCDITPDMYSPEDCMEIVERAGDDREAVGMGTVVELFNKWKHHKNIKLAFEIIDTDKDSFVSKEEIGQIMEQINAPLTEAELNAMMVMADRDKDNMLSFEEFKYGILAGEKST